MKEQAFTVATPCPQSAAIPFWKRILDLVCIVAALPFVAPLMAIIAILIKTISRGPALFKQDRIGYLGSTFKCFKFRTMKIDSSVGAHQNYLKDLIQCERAMTKMDLIGDSRLFPLASFLRATG